MSCVSFLSKRPTGVVRLVRRLHHSVLIKPYREREVKRDGFSFLLNYDSIVDRRIIRSNLHYERKQIEFFFNEANQWQADVFLDIGAYFGYYSLIAAKAGLFGEIHAVEPIPENYRRLKWHIDKNGYAEIIVPHNIAASDCNSNKKFRTQLSNSRVLDSAAEEEAVNISCTRLDDLFHHQGKRLAIKLDVENHELAVIAGAEELFRNNDVFMQVEIFPGNEKVITHLCRNHFELVHYIAPDFYFRRAATV